MPGCPCVRSLDRETPPVLHCASLSIGHGVLVASKRKGEGEGYKWRTGESNPNCRKRFPRRKSPCPQGRQHTDSRNSSHAAVLPFSRIGELWFHVRLSLSFSPKENYRLSVKETENSAVGFKWTLSIFDEAEHPQQESSVKECNVRRTCQLVRND